MRQVAADNPKVRLIQAPELPEAWTGKTHALHVGVRCAKGEFLLFTDADVVFSGTVVSEMVKRMQEHHLDFLGGMFGIDCHSVAEKITAPMLCAMGRAAMAITARHIGSGTGAFNLVRRSAYIAAGGHEAIRGEIVDDVALARLMRKHTDKIAFVPETARDVRVRLFKGWRGYWNAIAPSSIPFLADSRLLAIALAIPFLVLAGVALGLPIWAALNIRAGAGSGNIFSTTLGVVQLAAYAIGASLVQIGKTRCDSSWLWGVFYRIALLLMVLCVMWTTLRQMLNSDIAWWGRVYHAKGKNQR